VKKRSFKFYKNVSLSSILRVNHAGEYAAVRIYKAQVAVFKRCNNKEYSDLLQHMLEQEEVHCSYFERQLADYNMPFTIFLGVWNFLASSLGYCSAKMGKKYAMACTIAVEEVIDHHYSSQLNELDDCYSDIKDSIVKFRLEELEHRDTGIEYHGKEAIGYVAFSSIVSFGCKFAIFLSKRI